MISYLVRRILYAIPILIGVNLLTFLLFFVVNSPDDMARMQLGQKRVSNEAVLKWKQERGYDKPHFFDAAATGTGKLTNTIFYEKSVPLFWFDFGHAEDGRAIAHEVRSRMLPSLAIALPVFIVGMLSYITFSLLMAFFRATYIDFLGVLLCIFAMSVSGLFYIIGGQYLISKLWNLVPISGYADGLNAFSGEPERLAGREGRDVIITPHPGEMARLVGMSTDEVQSSRLEIARNFAAAHHLYVVLKGHRTLIATPDEKVFINSTGNPGMATGGTGDVLTGMIAGWLAQLLDAEAACKLAVYLHGMAGDLAEADEGEQRPN